MNLSSLPTLALLAELGRRCQAACDPAVPSWARPVLALVAEEEGITLAELMDTTNHSASAARSRHLAMAILQETHPRRSLSEIAGIFSLSHVMAIHARRRIVLLVAQSPAIAAKWHSVITSCGQQAHCRTSPQVTSPRTPEPAHRSATAPTPA